jgi:RimJ/RimL family protein N-acetyltransferase
MGTIDVKPFTCSADYERMLDYFFQADAVFLQGMGVDPAKLLNRDVWLNRLLADLRREDREKETYYLGWFNEGVPVGHSNINKIIYGQEAHLHLHIWDRRYRKCGMGTVFLRESIKKFSRKFSLKSLYCEPYAENPGPNRTLAKLGFRLIKRYRTVPGIINFEQEVNRYVMDWPVTTPDTMNNDQSS